MFSIGNYAIKKIENVSVFENDHGNILTNHIIYCYKSNKITFKNSEIQIPKPTIVVSPRTTKIAYNSPLKLSNFESLITTTTSSPLKPMVNATGSSTPIATTTTNNNPSVNGNHKRLKCVDRAIKYPVVKNVYFLTRGIYISLTVRSMF